MRRRVTVCFCVCTSVKSNLTSGASVRPESTVTYSADNEGQKVFSEEAPLQRSSTPSVERPYIWSAIKVRMRINHACAVSGRHRELSFVNCPPSKVLSTMA